MANRDACELYIEQEIKVGLESGKKPWTIGKELAGWIEKLFEVKMNPQTIKTRALRMQEKICSNEQNKSKPTETIEYSKPEIIQDRKQQGGGAREGAGRPIKFVAMPDNTQFRTSFTGENEWYTPTQYIESARIVMGGIDIDPASSDFAQSRIKAHTFYTVENDGLKHKWEGRMWMNPPYSQPLQSKFIEKAVDEYKLKNITQAIILTHNYTDTAWFHLAESVAALICFTKGRVKFERDNGEVAAPTQGSAFFYFGNKKEKFIEEFKKYGFIR